MAKRLLALTFVLLLLSSCAKEIPDGVLPDYIFAGGKLYGVYETGKGSKYDVEDLEYLGSLTNVGKIVPTEELTANGFAAGTEVYRIDGESLYIVYSGSSFDYLIFHVDGIGT